MGGIYKERWIWDLFIKFSLDDFRTFPRTHMDGCLSTARIFLSLSLTMASMIKKQLYNASSTIFNIAEASILFELPSKFFGHSCYYDSCPLFSAASHFRQALEQRTITKTPLIMPPTKLEFCQKSHIYYQMISSASPYHM